jgi:cell filamentation protein
MAFLPPRDPPTGQRYRISLGKVREELDRYSPAARAEAAARLQKLEKDDAPGNRISAARIELAYVRHAKGPDYQAHLLTSLGQREVEAVISEKQTPLERVREIGAGLAARINSLQPAQVQRAVQSLEHSVFPPEQTRADHRLGGAREVADKARDVSRASVAMNIRANKASDEAVVPQNPERSRPSAPEKGRGR